MPRILVLELLIFWDLPRGYAKVVFEHLHGFAAFRHEQLLSITWYGMLRHRPGHGTACVSALEARCGYGGCCRLLLIVQVFAVFCQVLRAEG